MKNNYIALITFLLISLSVSAQKQITILHTNDTHSRIEPMPLSDSAPNTAGAARRLAYIDKIRKENKNTILLDAGDFVQGTPYFNLFKGRVETQVMNTIKYDAGTLGNHEFDYGLDTLKRIIGELNYPIVNCNYDFSATVLKDMVKPYIILKKNGLKIGILGVGVDPEGMIKKDNYEGMIFNPIISSANHFAKILKIQEQCDLVICLSHIGYTSADGVPNDVELAKQSEYIDIIIGGHTHTYMSEPDVRKNLKDRDVLVYQMGKHGRYVGKIDVTLSKTSKHD